ncbi:AraC family transcriptional regulator [Pseudonocardia sp. H11422]|uniref:AraC family transcriptional regulator n=1 Tax=Pseudonocardia sp. H11422 TaxID=2835866 RepID=UPI001BDD9092|nr:AraC family transcriptional regulator [Pseudonocardia sp. H11422]
MGEEPFGRHRVAWTTDFAEAHAAMESVFLPLRMRLNEPTPPARPLDMALNALRVNEVTVSYVRFGRDIHIHTAEAENYHVNAPLCGRTDSRTGRLERVRSTPGRAAVFLPDLPGDIDWRGDCAQFCLMFPRRALQTELEAMLDRPVNGPIEFAPAMDLTTDHGKAWMDALRLIERQSRCLHSLLDHPLATGNLERLLIDGLLLAQPHNYTVALTGPRRPAAPQAVRQTVELIQCHPEQPWTTASLARRVAVSARCLQQGFQRSVGVPPMRYLREVRLNRVYDDLRAAAPHSVSVSQVAGRWGFLYFGRFAAAYRQKFGQTPSQTLRGPVAAARFSASVPGWERAV